MNDAVLEAYDDLTVDLKRLMAKQVEAAHGAEAASTYVVLRLIEIKRIKRLQQLQESGE